MDKPYILWTLRRTGGTTLASILSQASSHPKVAHEPFNPDRIYGDVGKKWEESGDILRTREDISSILKLTPSIKHCFEIVPMQLNSILLQETTREGYRHIILRRRSEVERLFSLEVASLTGAWGPEDAKRKYTEISSGGGAGISLRTRSSLLHMAECYLRSRWLLGELKKRKQNYMMVDFEDLYGSIDVGCRKVSEIFTFLGHTKGRYHEFSHIVRDKLEKGNQGTRQISQHIENAEEWKGVIRKNWRAMTMDQ